LTCCVALTTVRTAVLHCDEAGSGDNWHYKTRKLSPSVHQ